MISALSCTFSRVLSYFLIVFGFYLLVCCGHQGPQDGFGGMWLSAHICSVLVLFDALVFFPLWMAPMHGEKFNLSKQRLHVLMMNNTVTTCLRLLHCSRQPYPFPHLSLQESSILHHTYFPLIHSPSHSLTYMESHGCMLSFTPSHTH